jgi:putative transposase
MCAGAAGAPRRVSEGDVSPLAQPIRGLKAEDAKRLKDLERENATLKRLLVDAELEKAALRMSGWCQGTP